jgi:hypothetical protein
MDLPVYKELVSTMGFDPATVASFDFADWDLEQTYPPTVGELVGQLSRHRMPEQEETDAGQGSSEALGSGESVPGGSQDGDAVGTDEENRLAQDPGGASASVS